MNQKIKSIDLINTKLGDLKVSENFVKNADIETLEKVRDFLRTLDNGEKRDILDAFEDPRYKRVDKELSSKREIEDLRKLPKSTKLYVIERSLRSDMGGLHGKYNVFYMKDNSLIQVWIPSEMKKDRANGGLVYVRSGGGYSFSHDIVMHLGYLAHNDGYYFEKVDL
jgi:hypothetical protein